MKIKSATFDFHGYEYLLFIFFIVFNIPFPGKIGHGLDFLYRNGKSYEMEIIGTAEPDRFKPISLSV